MLQSMRLKRIDARTLMSQPGKVHWMMSCIPTAGATRSTNASNIPCHQFIFYYFLEIQCQLTLDSLALYSPIVTVVVRNVTFVATPSRV